MSQKRDFISVTDLSPAETRQLIEQAAQGKSEAARAPLAGKTVALLFEKPSLRTKVSFQVGVAQLGGYSMYMGGEEVGLGVREPVSDVARVLSGYVDCIVARVFRHEDLRDLAEYASVPVINALSDWEHPCQTMADLLTVYEHKGRLDGLTLAYIGDGNNVARSLCLALPAVGMNFNCASPAGYELDAESVATAAGRGTGVVKTMRSPSEAVATAEVVYTDVWASMGQEDEAAQRRQEFAGYTVDPALMAPGPPGRAVHARYASPLRRGSAARDAGAPAVGGLSASAQPPARPEGRDWSSCWEGDRLSHTISPSPLYQQALALPLKGEGTLETRFQAQ